MCVCVCVCVWYVCTCLCVCGGGGCTVYETYTNKHAIYVFSLSCTSYLFAAFIKLYFHLVVCTLSLCAVQDCATVLQNPITATSGGATRYLGASRLVTAMLLITTVTLVTSSMALVPGHVSEMERGLTLLLCVHEVSLSILYFSVHFSAQSF